MSSEDRSDDPKYTSWARAVKVRDNFTCQICFRTDTYLESHHIDSWDWCIDSRYKLENGICICAAESGCKAHKFFHQIFGYGGNHSFQFEQFKKIYKIFTNLLSSPSKTDPL